jgi:hypothetical protein
MGLLFFPFWRRLQVEYRQNRLLPSASPKYSLDGWQGTPLMQTRFLEQETLRRAASGIRAGTGARPYGDPHAFARASSSARSRVLSVSAAARSSSPFASAWRPSLISRSARTVGSR